MVSFQFPVYLGLVDNLFNESNLSLVYLKQYRSTVEVSKPLFSISALTSSQSSETGTYYIIIALHKFHDIHCRLHEKFKSHPGVNLKALCHF